MPSRTNPRPKSHPRHSPRFNHDRHPPALPNGVRILHEDRSLLVADKPAGLLTIGTENEKRRTLYSILLHHLRRRRPPERLFIVHRLDREASGLLVFAKTESAKHGLQDQFKTHSAGRTYLAITQGRIVPDTFTIDACLAENTIHRVYVTPDTARGKHAVTHGRVLERTADTTRVEIRLETGRKHQIRVHLADRGHPILGDPFYGNGRNPFRRLALHGVTLSFTHPDTGKGLEFTSPPPPFMAGRAAGDGGRPPREAAIRRRG